MKHLPSIFTDEQELLKAIIEIHNDKLPIDLDPMFNKGKFYKNMIIELPKHRYDLNPENNGIPFINNPKYWNIKSKDYTNGINILKGDATNLPLENESIKSIILDPPFMWRKMLNSKSKIADRYTMFDNFNELEILYKGIIKEASRLLSKKGLLIFKCQDFTNSKTTMTHCFVFKWLLENNFYVKDLAILNKQNKITNPNTTQRHFRKTHTYFFVAIKKGK